MMARLMREASADAHEDPDDFPEYPFDNSPPELRYSARPLSLEWLAPSPARKAGAYLVCHSTLNMGAVPVTAPGVPLPALKLHLSVTVSWLPL